MMLLVCIFHWDETVELPSIHDMQDHLTVVQQN